MSGTRLTCKKFDWSRRVFQLGPPSLLLGLVGPGLPGRISIECPVAPRCHRHLPSSRPGSLRWSAPSSIEIELGCDATFLSVPSPTPPWPSRTATYEPVRARTLAAPALNTPIFFLQGCSLEVGPLAVSGWQTGRFPGESTPSALV